MSGSLQGLVALAGYWPDCNPAILNPPTFNFCHGILPPDGNGNVTCLIYTNQTIAAKYEYDPYGTILSQAGPWWTENLYRFSSKEYHPASGLIYYLYRYYDASLQRWLIEIRIGERGLKLLRKRQERKIGGETLQLRSETIRSILRYIWAAD